MKPISTAVPSIAVFVGWAERSEAHADYDAEDQDLGTVLCSFTHPLAGYLTEFCLAIQSREGYYPPGVLKAWPIGTPAYFYNNPGDLKYGEFAISCGATG